MLLNTRGDHLYILRDTTQYWRPSIYTQGYHSILEIIYIYSGIPLNTGDHLDILRDTTQYWMEIWCIIYYQCYLKCMRIKTCFIWTGVITVAKHLMTYNTLIVCNLTHLSIYPFVYLSGFLNHFFLYLLYFYSFLSVSPFFLFISFLSVFFSLIICFVLFNIKPFSTFLVHISFFSIFKSVSIQLYHVIFIYVSNDLTLWQFLNFELDQIW